MFLFEIEDFKEYWRQREENKQKRKDGRYLVNNDGRWMVGEFHDGKWYFGNPDVAVDDEVLREIDERPVPPPIWSKE